MPNDKKDQSKPAGSSNPPAEEESLDATEQPAPEQAAPDSAQQAGAEQAAEQPKKSGAKGKFGLFNNMYLLVFGVIIIVGLSVVFVALKAAKPQTKTEKATSLTDQQLSSLRGNTTLVGDSKQTLDVQSNSIFEGQVLLRSDLNVAGAIKVGGAFAVPSISVGGGGTFGQLGVNGGLNVGGDTTLQGGLAVQKNLTVSGTASFGNLSISQLSVSTLLLRNDLSLSRHVVTSGGVPARTNGTAVGGGGNATVSGSDTAGTVSVNTGSSPPAGCFINISFTQKYANTPHVVISPSNSSAGSLDYYTNRSSSGFSICTANVPAASTSYIFDYIVLD